MPDHFHESECLAGYDLCERYDHHGLNIEEFPPFKGHPLAPEIIATSISAGRFAPPTIPRCFGTISVWDGYQVDQGRIVCHATWHHFVNINLVGTGEVPVPGNNRNGLRDACLNFTEDFHQIAEYYRNIADWLTPKKRRLSRFWMDILIERYRYPLVEEWQPLSANSGWRPRVDLGKIVERAFNAHHGRGFSEEIVLTALEVAITIKGGQNKFDELLLSLTQKCESQDSSPAHLLTIDELRYGFLGSIFDFFAQKLPPNPVEIYGVIEKKMKENDGNIEKTLDNDLFEAVKSAAEVALEYFKECILKTIEVLDMKLESKVEEQSKS
jgi:hypothetical protein